MSIENMEDKDIERLEAEIREKRKSTSPSHQHYGPVENLSESEIKRLEAEIRERGKATSPSYQHYGSVENMDEAGMKIMEAQVLERRQQDAPYVEYFNNLINDLDITDKAEFESAVVRSMESNEIMRKFVDDLCHGIGEKTFELKNIDGSDRTKIESIKKRIEKMVAVYERYMYTLKGKQWNFSNISRMRIHDDVINDLWQQQKRLDITFEMPIPADMGEYYGGKFERDCKMVPGIELMYQDLLGKEVNWHQVMIYRENELTPSQRYKQRLIGEITDKQTELNSKKKELSELTKQRQQEGVMYGE